MRWGLREGLLLQLGFKPNRVQRLGQNQRFAGAKNAEDDDSSFVGLVLLPFWLGLAAARPSESASG